MPLLTLPAALVSRHPIYDLMRDYLTLSWARFSKDVQAHTLQIAKILSHPAPRGGDVVRLDASAAQSAHSSSHKRSSSQNSNSDSSLEVVCRFPGGLDFGRGLVDANFTMWPLFKALDLDNILTICEVGMAPTGRVLFLSRYPAMLGVAVLTIKYLLELRGWSGIACPIVHCRDARIYVDVRLACGQTPSLKLTCVQDPGPWIIGMPTEARYTVHTTAEVCIVDLDINHVSCAAPPLGYISSKATRERYRRQLLTAFDAYWHPDCSIPSEFKEAFPAGRFRPLTKIQSKRAGIASVAAESVAPPEWWNGPKVIQAFNAVLTEKSKKPSLLKRLTGVGRRQLALTTAEQLIQLSIRKRATAFVDSRDEMESKIGRLARRLNFLMTESDLWREKFVTFEKYAEKLSVESSELRAKINKEQRESRRLSGLVSVTAQEKIRLQSRAFPLRSLLQYVLTGCVELQDTERAHKDARTELERMRAEIERMESERASMIAEVEAQIERALSSMAFSETESDIGAGGGSRASSRRPSFRAGSAAGSAFGDVRDESIAEEDGDVDAVAVETSKHESAVKKEDGAKVQNFDGTAALPDGNMNAVDMGITEKSERIARKVLAIQEKVMPRLHRCVMVVLTTWVAGVGACRGDAAPESPCGGCCVRRQRARARARAPAACRRAARKPHHHSETHGLAAHGVQEWFGRVVARRPDGFAEHARCDDGRLVRHGLEERVLSLTAPRLAQRRRRRHRRVRRRGWRPACAQRVRRQPGAQSPCAGPRRVDREHAYG